MLRKLETKRMYDIVVIADDTVGMGQKREEKSQKIAWNGNADT